MPSTVLFSQTPVSRHPPAKRPKYERATIPPPHAVTTRDLAICVAIQRHNGLLADYQIAALFFDGVLKTAKNRLSRLYHNGYLDRLRERERLIMGYMVYYNDEKGAALVAQHQGIALKALSWRRVQDSWSLVPHDIELGNVVLALEREVARLPEARIVAQADSRQLRQAAERVVYHDRRGVERTRRLEPDGYFHVTTTQGGLVRHSHLWIEYDRSTEDQVRIDQEKIRPGLAFLASAAYREQFGVNAGRWLVIVQTERRLMNMKAVAKRVGPAAKAFYFTTYAQAVAPGAFFTQSIWQRAWLDTLVSLFQIPHASAQ